VGFGGAQSDREVSSEHELVRAKRAEIERLCRSLAVCRLDVFGSAVGDLFDTESSDVDVLVEFDAGRMSITRSGSANRSRGFRRYVQQVWGRLRDRLGLLLAVSGRWSREALLRASNQYREQEESAQNSFRGLDG
jgi:predicted nucleotidyltransferase